jgi:ParB-like chromosome segregation protein Spo0J
MRKSQKKNSKIAKKTDFKSPVYSVIAVPLEKVRANSYNPNAVAPPEMALLETSIWEDGYTMPVVCYYIKNEDVYEIVDGFHRYTTLKNSKRIYERENGMLPVVVIDKDESNRMASTIRHNRARGSHSIELMSNIVAELTNAGMSDAWILKHVGMDKDELLRLKQITGIADLFKDQKFSAAWSGKNKDFESSDDTVESKQDQISIFGDD